MLSATQRSVRARKRPNHPRGAPTAFPAALPFGLRDHFLETMDHASEEPRRRLGDARRVGLVRHLAIEPYRVAPTGTRYTSINDLYDNRFKAVQGSRVQGSSNLASTMNLSTMQNLEP